MLRAAPVTLLLAATLLPVASRASLAPVLQSRTVWARAVGGPEDSQQSDQNRIDAPDFGEFDATATADVATATNFFGSAMARQFSSISPDGVALRGMLDTRTGDGALGEASSDCLVVFSIPGTMQFQLSYDMNVDFLGVGSGGASLALTAGREGGPPVVPTIHLGSLQDARDTVGGTLVPGTYTLDFSAFLSVDEFKTIPYDVTLSLTDATTVVPLPPAILSGGLMLAAVATTIGLRRARLLR